MDKDPDWDVEKYGSVADILRMLRKELFDQ